MDLAVFVRFSERSPSRHRALRDSWARATSWVRLVMVGSSYAYAGAGWNGRWLFWIFSRALPTNQNIARKEWKNDEKWAQTDSGLILRRHIESH